MTRSATRIQPATGMKVVTRKKVTVARSKASMASWKRVARRSLPK